MSNKRTGNNILSVVCPPHNGTPATHAFLVEEFVFPPRHLKISLNFMNRKGLYYYVLLCILCTIYKDAATTVCWGQKFGCIPYYVKPFRNNCSFGRFSRLQSDMLSCAGGSRLGARLPRGPTAFLSDDPHNLCDQSRRPCLDGFGCLV